jgi:hypothetical protein
MPYKSAKQRAYMHIHHPEIAKRWDKEYGGKIVSNKKDNKKSVTKRIIHEYKRHGH